MTATVIIDAIVVMILAGFVIHGARRGLLRSLAGLIIVVMALVGAGMMAAAFSGPAARLAVPLLEERITARVEEAMRTQEGPSLDWDDDPDGVLLLLERLGLDEETCQELLGPVMDALAGFGESASLGEAVSAVTGAVMESLTRSMIYGILYILSFAALLILLRILLEAMNLVMKLPVLHGLNAVGGGLLGLAEGALLLFLAVWIARRLGVSFEAASLADARILHIFTANTPLSLLSFLQ